LEVKAEDARQAMHILEQDYIRSTGLSHHDLSTADAVFDEQGATAVCPACGKTFSPGQTSTCPECGLIFG
jgi:rRNA maturation endonuclease Nob1